MKKTKTSSAKALKAKPKKVKSDRDQKKSYWTPGVIGFKNFKLSEKRMPPEQYGAAMGEVGEYVKNAQDNFLGYQATQRMDFKQLARYMNVSLNNIGDSFSRSDWNSKETPPDGYFRMNNKWMERAVLDYYAKLWHARTPRLVEEDKEAGWLETYWGYVVSMGSTEGNLLAMRNGRDYLNGTELQFRPTPTNAGADDPEKGTTNPALECLIYERAVPEDPNPNITTPILFFSSATHYSIKKIAQILQIKTFYEEATEKRYEHPGGGKWPETIGINKDGSINLRELFKYADFFSKKGYPIIVNFNYGTTWSGAYDDIETGTKGLVEILKRNRTYERTFRVRNREITRKGFWFHSDGALGAAVVPYLKMGEKIKPGKKSAFPEFDFKLEIQSISMSGHKWIGIPWPCGIYMTKNKYLISNNVPSYVGSLDSTLAGSRNGLSSLLMWDYLAKRSYKDLGNEIMEAMKLAEYAEAKLSGRFPGKVTRAPGSLAIVFPKPSLELLKKYALASQNDNSHIFIMRHVTKGMIDHLIADLGPPGEVESSSLPKLPDLSHGW